MRRLRTRLRTASSGNGPFPGSALYINFSAGSTLDSRVTFSRGTNATLVDSTGKITYAPANLLTYSQEFDNAAWTKTRSSITANSTAAPDGATTADKLIEDSTASNTHFIVTQFALSVAPSTIVYSVYLKAAERTRAQVDVSDNATGGMVLNVNLSDGTFTSSSSGSWSGVFAGVQSVGGGWYRCFLRGTQSSGFVLPRVYIADASGSTTYTGNGTSGLFIWGAQLEPVTYQTTPSTYVATTSAAYYGPRFDYDPVTLAAKGLLIEEARTNLVLYSEQFDNAAWVKSQVTVTANATLAPNGLLVADKIIENTAATTYHAIYPGTSPTGSVTGSYTFTVYAKAAERRYISLDMNSYLDGVVFDLQNGAVTGTSTFYTSSITPAGNGWYRCSVSKNYTVATMLYAEAIISTSATVPNAYTGDGTSGVFLYGAQLEAGAFATSYIPTVASTVTRSADVATMTGTNFSSWYNQSEGTFVSDFDKYSVTSRGGVLCAGNTLVATGTDIAIDGQNDAKVRMFIENAGAVEMLNATLATYAASTPIKAAAAYATNNAVGAAAGALGTVDTSVVVPTLNALQIGAIRNSNAAATLPLNGHIRQIAYYNTRLPNAQLQALTAPSMVTTLSLDFINGVYDA